MIFCPCLTRGTAILAKSVLTSLHHSDCFTSKQALFLPKLTLHIHVPKVIHLQYQVLYTSFKDLSDKTDLIRGVDIVFVYRIPKNERLGLLLLFTTIFVNL